jgi:hypothetical protein
MSYKTVIYADFDRDEILRDIAQWSNKKITLEISTWFEKGETVTLISFGSKEPCREIIRGK